MDVSESAPSPSARLEHPEKRISFLNHQRNIVVESYAYSRFETPGPWPYNAFQSRTSSHRSQTLPWTTEVSQGAVNEINVLKDQFGISPQEICH